MSFDATETEKSLTEKLQELALSLRAGQKSLVDWEGGEMAISAVPGAGKSHSLAVAAALVIARYQLHFRKQLVIVTYTRSAAASIKAKIRDQLKQINLPQGGLQVQTLHGLALNIASRHRELSGLDLDTATLIIPTASHRLIRSSVEKWIVATSVRYQALLVGQEFDGEETERLRRQSVLRTEVLPQLTYTVVREAKSSGLLPEDLWEISQESRDVSEILAVAAGLYQQYERLMRQQNFIDYDDMILAALRVLENPSIRNFWQNQVFAVFEDEAQDSSPLQEKLITVLAGNSKGGEGSLNLIRVGDPNQAINSTFTPADPIYFNWFCNTCQKQGRLATMDRAGRSSRIIIAAANFVLGWVNQNWGKKSPQQWSDNSPKPPLNNGGSQWSDEKEELPFRFQEIQPVDPGDPQPEANPAPVGKGLEIYRPRDIYHTVELIGQRVVELLTENQERNAAILVRENRQGRFLTEQLAKIIREHEHIKVYEVSEVDRHSHIPAEILKLLQFLHRPHSPDYLKEALGVLVERQLIPTQDLNALATFPEQFLYPTPLEPPQKRHVKKARRYCCNLLRARLELPHYQLISFLGMTLKYTGSELATVQKLAERVNLQILGQSSLESAIAALAEIVSSEKFEGVEEDTDDQYTRVGQVTIITMHKAKGLDWDYVFIPFLHEDTLPGNLWVPTGAKFLGDFTLAEIARAQLRAAVHAKYKGKSREIPDPVSAWEQAQQLKDAEEYRLLYVAMTRAKRLLWMSACQLGPFRWSVFQNDGSGNLQEKKPCPVLPVLQQHFPNCVCK